MEVIDNQERVKAQLWMLMVVVSFVRCTLVGVQWPPNPHALG